jgi:hypothetical protein
MMKHGLISTIKKGKSKLEIAQSDAKSRIFPLTLSLFLVAVKSQLSKVRTKQYVASGK